MKNIETPNPLTFWHENLGRYLSSEAPAATLKARIPTRMKKGIGPNPLGAGISAYYLVSQGHAWLFGLIEQPDTAQVTFVPSDKGRSPATSEIAKMLVEGKVETPLMVGVIGNASPLASLRLSTMRDRIEWCEAGKNFQFNLNAVQNAIGKIGQLLWWKEVRPALFQYHAMLEARRSGNAERTEKEQKKMVALINKTPALATLLPTLDIRPNSGEITVLGWFYRDEKASDPQD